MSVLLDSSHRSHHTKVYVQVGELQGSGGPWGEWKGVGDLPEFGASTHSTGVWIHMGTKDK